MSEWTQRIREHRIWGLLDGLGPKLDLAFQVEGIDPPSTELLGRLKTILALCGKRLGATDPLVLTPAILDSIAGPLESQISEIDAFITDKNSAHITTANSTADSALVQLSHVPGIAAAEELVSWTQAVNSYRSILEEQMQRSFVARQEAKSQIEHLTVGLSEVKTQLEGERQKLAAIATDQQKAFSDAQDTRAKTFSDTVLEVQKQLTKTLTDQQGQFSIAQESRNTEFTNTQREHQNSFSAVIADYTKRLADRDYRIWQRIGDSFSGQS